VIADWDPIADGYSQFTLSGQGFGAAFGPMCRRPEEWLMCFRVESRHCNPVGNCHGGALATFADAQLLAMPGHTGDPTKHTPTVNLTMDYLAPAKLGQWVILKLELLRTTRTFLFTQGVLRTEDGAVARSSAIYRNNDRTGYPIG
jgi:uncharacterized protein (TIGR00369 family)